MKGSSTLARHHRLALRCFAVLAALLAPLGPTAGPARPALAQSATHRIAAVVNDDVVTSQDLLDRLAFAVATSGLPNDQATRQRLAPQVLRGFIDEKLQIQEARRLGLEVTEAEVDQAMETVAKRNNTNRVDLTRYLVSVGLNPGTLRDQLRAQIAWIKIVSRELRPQIVVTQDQIDLALRRGAEDDTNVELLLSEILLPVYDRAQEASVVEDARGLAASIRGGADFSGLARQVSAAASAENGGDLGWVRAGAITPDLRDRILSLDVGEVSDPIVSPAGVHVIQVRDQRSPQEDGGAGDRERVRQTIEQEQLERQATRYLRELRRDAFIDVRI
jgi:peptidyl-prolyl cis-trans isomerase SurA